MTIGTTVPSVVINFLAIDHGLIHVSTFLALMFVGCLLMMPFFYPFEDGINEDKIHASTKRRDSKSLDNIQGTLFFVSVVLFYFGFMMSYIYLVEIVEFRSTEEISTTQRSLIISTFSLANGSARIFVSLMTNYFKMCPQIVSSSSLILNSLVIAALSFVTDFYILLILVALFGLLNSPYSAFTVPTVIRLFGGGKLLQSYTIIFSI